MRATDRASAAIVIFRHVFGYGVLLPVLLSLIAVQAIVVAPLTGNRRTIPHLVYRACGWIFGIRYRLNPQSAPFEAGRVTMFAANHLSRLDFGALYLFPDAAVMMNAGFFQMPVIGRVIKAFANSAGIVGTDQSQGGKVRDLARLAKAMRRGRNIFLFPEGVQTDGRRVLRYSRGAAEIFYGSGEPGGAAPLDGRLQPVVFRVSELNGEDVLDRPEEWDPYTLTRRMSNIFVNMSRRATQRSVTVDILVLPPLEPADHADAESLMNAAQDTARGIVAPDQTKILTRADWLHRRETGDFSL